MKRQLGFIIATGLLLSACNSDDTESKKNESDVKVSDKAEKERLTTEITTEKPTTEELKNIEKTIDINSAAFKNSFVQTSGEGYQGIEPGLTYAEVKNKLGQYNGTNDFAGGLNFNFGSYALIFDGVTTENELTDRSKIEYVYITPDQQKDLAVFSEVWGEKSDYASLPPSGVASINYYDVDGKRINAMVANGQVIMVTKHDIQKITNGKNESAEVRFNNGKTHLIYPKIDTYEYGQVILTNSFNIYGFHAGDPVGDLISKLGQPDKTFDDDLGATYQYDNFAVTVKDDRIYRYLLNVKEEQLDPDLQSIWQVTSEDTQSELARFDGNKTNGFYVEVNPDMGPGGGIDSIAIIGDNYQGPEVGQPDNDTLSKETILSEDFAYSVLSNEYDIGGYHAGDAASKEDIIEAAGAPDDEGESSVEYGPASAMFLDDKIESISIDVSSVGLTIGEIRSAWGYEYKIIDSEDGDYTVYDMDKTNGYHVEILPTGVNDDVQSIIIHGQDYEINHL